MVADDLAANYEGWLKKINAYFKAGTFHCRLTIDLLTYSPIHPLHLLAKLFLKRFQRADLCSCERILLFFQWHKSVVR